MIIFGLLHMSCMLVLLVIVFKVVCNQFEMRARLARFGCGCRRSIVHCLLIEVIIEFLSVAACAVWKQDLTEHNSC